MCLCVIPLLQDSGEDDTGVVLFKMHVSIRHFGQKAIEAEMGYILRYIDDPEFNNVTEHCRYVIIEECDTWPSNSLLPAHKICAINCFSCSKMELKDDPFSVPSCLRVLNLAKTSIQKLPHSICHLEQLGYLNLSGCSRLVDLPEIFGYLKNLLHINLSGCSELVNLPESFGMLKILQHINLSGCSGLVTLGEPFVKLTSLVHINLSGCCALINLPEFFGKLVNLMHLNLSGCSSLVALPGSFGKLIKLVHISLSGCSGLKKLPQSFGSLTSLVHINLSGCSSLSTLPNSIGYLRNLLHIDLSRCYGLSKLPKSFGKLQKLEHIGLSGCSGLVTLPESFGGLINLLHINLSHCSGLSKLPESFRNLRKLVYLDLSFWSCFEGIQIALGGLTRLQHLNLSHPCCYRADHIHLEGLKEVFHKLNSLQYLNLSMLLNPISYNQSEEKICEYIESISGLYSLEHLDLSHNIFLRDLPESLGDLYRLHTLDLSGCIRLKRLGKWMAKMDSLKSIILRDCEGLESYQFVVGVDDSINNYVQLEDVTSKELEIRCLERIKCLEEAKRIRLVEKRKLQELKLCWTVDPKSSTSVNNNKSEVSAEENKPNRSMEENEHKDLVQDNKPDRSEEENKPEGFVQENKPDKSKEENILDRSTEENEPKGSTHENKPKSSVQENTPKKSEKESIPDRSVEEIEHEGPVQVNIVNKSKEENIHDKYVEEIIEDGGSVQENKPDSSEVENKPDKSVEEIVLEDYVHENKLNSSEKENKPGRSLEETVLEGSVQENKPNKPEEENINIPDKSVEEIVREGSEEENKPDRSVDEIDCFYDYRRPNSSLREDKPDGVVEENVLLGALVPPQNLKCLGLHGYSGETCRPCWWTEERCSANLPNLEEVTMENFPSCRTLPPFGMLPNLKILVLKRMASITRINASDLSGSKNSELECTIEDMPSLEEFNTTYIRGDKKSTFSDIGKLVVKNCPLVRFGTLPPRARMLVISECEKGMDFLGEMQEGHEEEGTSCTSDPITKLVVVESCSKPLSQWSLLNHLSILPSLTIRNCSLLKLCSLDNDDDNSVPEYLGYLTSLPELKIESCKDVNYRLLRWIIQKLASLKSLHFINCEDLSKLPEELGDLTSLQTLAFERCPTIDSLPDSISKLTNLKDLHIPDCRGLKRWYEKKENKSRLGHLRIKI
jgi:Leucine-rich repeat (LRR) protein